MNSPSRTANVAPAPPRRGFWNRITEGLALQELWAQFRGEASAGYGHYSQEVDWEAIGKGPKIGRPFAVVGALFMAMLMKMSPARRVALVIAIACIILGRMRLAGGEVDLTFEFRWVGIGLLFLLLALELADRVTMKRDLEIAREIQRWLVPAEPPVVKGLDIAFATRPANTVAGDYYDAFLRTPPGGGDPRLLLVVADVAGKSVPAALLMATFQASLHALATASDSLEGLMSGLNRYAVVHSLGGARFTTAFIAEYEPATRHLTYVCAGHNAPVLRHVSGAVDRLDKGGLPLGIEADVKFETGETTLARGDLLLIFTDGVIETVNGNGEEYGEAGLLHLLTIVPGESAAEILRHLYEDLDRHAGSAPQRDDVTCLIVQAT